jgi:outer membrane protein assembly factor BamB
VTSYRDFEEGEASGVLLSSFGEAASGFSSARINLPEAVVFSSVTAPDGTVYFGTGDEGVVYAYQKGKVKQLCKLDAVLISALAVGDHGRLFVGAMPGGKIFAVEHDGKNREVAHLGAEHVWSLAYDDTKRTLYAATGPRGQLFAIDGSEPGRSTVQSRVRMIYDSGEKHLLSLIRGEGGALYAGSADQAILYRISPTRRGADVHALHDFEGDEIRAIARKDSVLYVAVNEFQKTNPSASDSSGPVPSRGTKMIIPAESAAAPAPGRDRRGKGAVYRVDSDGRVEQLHALANGYFTSLYVTPDGDVYAASGSNGRVYLIHPDRTVQTAFDFPERQVLTLAFAGPEHLLGTGDAGAIYRVSAEPPTNAGWTSKVFDAQFPSHFGSVRWGGSGGLTVETRSGNTSHPDNTWSTWQAPLRTRSLPDGGVGKVASSDARYLQTRVNFAKRSHLRDFSIYYQPQNQRARVNEIVVSDESSAKRTSSTQRTQKPHSPVVKLRWKVENPDDDELVYRLFFREEGEFNWKPIGGPEPLSRAEFDWNTESIPDGNYEVKLVASDERANPKEQALEHSLTSAPFLVDNRKPELDQIQVVYPTASGRAHDSFSSIAELAFSVDGGDWQPFASRDGVLDDPIEEFTVKLPAGLTAGTHSLAIRAVDAADNVGAAQIAFRVK